jgi:hypothetical protein
MSTSRELLELHDVAGESACLVREDVFNLAELLIKVTGLCLAECSLIMVIHFEISCHEESLAELADF